MDVLLECVRRSNSVVRACSVVVSHFITMGNNNRVSTADLITLAYYVLLMAGLFSWELPVTSSLRSFQDDG